VYQREEIPVTGEDPSVSTPTLTDRLLALDEYDLLFLLGYLWVVAGSETFERALDLAEANKPEGTD
jgi:hypothetical protein